MIFGSCRVSPSQKTRQVSVAYHHSALATTLVPEVLIVPPKQKLLMQVRLMLVLAPAACCLAGVAVHEVLKVLMQAVRQPSESEEAPAPAVEPKKSTPQPKKGKASVKVACACIHSMLFISATTPTFFHWNGGSIFNKRCKVQRGTSCSLRRISA